MFKITAEEKKTILKRRKTQGKAMNAITLSEKLSRNKLALVRAVDNEGGYYDVTNIKKGKGDTVYLILEKE